VAPACQRDPSRVAQGLKNQPRRHGVGAPEDARGDLHRCSPLPGVHQSLKLTCTPCSCAKKAGSGSVNRVHTPSTPATRAAFTRTDNRRERACQPASSVRRAPRRGCHPQDRLQLLTTPRADGDLASIRSRRHPSGAGTAPLHTTPALGRDPRGPVGPAIQRHRTIPAVAEAPDNPSHGRRDYQMRRAHIRGALERGWWVAASYGH
jgi:hypothetical protein